MTFGADDFFGTLERGSAFGFLADLVSCILDLPCTFLAIAMNRLAIGCVALVMMCSCGPDPGTKPRVWEVDARAVHTAYRDGLNRWTGQVVRFRLGAKGYAVSGGDIHWFSERPTSSPDIIIVCPVPPKDNSGPLDVTAVCDGPVADDRTRVTGVGFYVRMRATAVTKPE